MIRLRDGTGRKTYSDRHPDPLAESIRQQVCEAQLIQALGRGRGIDRDESKPLNIDLLLNERVEVVDEVLLWKDQSALIETAVDTGVALTSPVDLVRIWPALWPNLERAKRAVRAGIPALPGFVEVEYRLDLPGMKRRIGYFDLNLIPNPMKWLEERLGPMAPTG